MADEDGGLRDRLSKQGEEALGKLASDLLENPLINSAITRAFSAREKAVHAQEAAMGALNLPSAADIDRLTRRLRTVSTRLEGIEESLDRLQDGVDKLTAKLEAVDRDAERRRSARASGGPAEQARDRGRGRLGGHRRGPAHGPARAGTARGGRRSGQARRTEADTKEEVLVKVPRAMAKKDKEEGQEGQQGC